MIVTSMRFAFPAGSLYVHLIMSQSNNDQHPITTENATSAAPAQRKPKRHNAKLCPLAIRERIVNALANGDSHRAIARGLRVSPNTVRAVAEQEWKRVEARKGRIAAQSERNATLAAERISEKLESSQDIPLNVLVPAFGVSVDKMTLLGATRLSLFATSTLTSINSNLSRLSTKPLRICEPLEPKSLTSQRCQPETRVTTARK